MLLAMRQRVDAPAASVYVLAARFRKTTAGNQSATARCEHFATLGCAGTATSQTASCSLLTGGVGVWQTFSTNLSVPSNTGSSRCGFELSTSGAVPFTSHVDRLSLIFGGDIFQGGLESGDTSAWNGTVDGNSLLGEELAAQGLIESDSGLAAGDLVASTSADRDLDRGLPDGTIVTFRPTARREVPAPDGTALALASTTAATKG